jgi:hypothetical protein
MSPESTLWRHHESTKGSRFHSSSNSIAISATVRGPGVVPSLQGWESCFDKRVSICGGRWSPEAAAPTAGHQLGHRDCARWSAKAATPTGSHELEHRDCGWRSPEAAAPTASHQLGHGDCGRRSAKAATPAGSHQLEHRDGGWRSPEAAAPTASHQFVHRESRIAASTHPHRLTFAGCQSCDW